MHDSEFKFDFVILVFCKNSVDTRDLSELLIIYLLDQSKSVYNTVLLMC